MSLGEVRPTYGKDKLSQNMEDKVIICISSWKCGVVGPVYLGAGCGNSACPVLRGLCWSDLAVLLD